MFALSQNKILDCVDNPELLDYSLLSGKECWEVWTNFFGVTWRRIAVVDWEWSPSYLLTTTSPDGIKSICRTIPFRQNIVTAVKAELARTYEEEIYDPEGAPLIRVVPQFSA